MDFLTLTKDEKKRLLDQFAREWIARGETPSDARQLAIQELDFRWEAELGLGDIAGA